MLWLILLAIFIVGLLILQESRKHNKNTEEVKSTKSTSPDSIIEDLEERANSFKESIYENFKRTKKNWGDSDDEKIKKLSMRLHAMELIYKRLKERLRHAAPKQRIALAEDWLHYNYYFDRNVDSLASLVLPGDGTSNKEEFEREMNEAQDRKGEAEIIIDEIEKRLKKLEDEKQA